METRKFAVVKFEDDSFELDVKADYENDTIWLTQEQIAELYEKGRSTITEHINNIFNEGELDENTSVGFSDKTKNGRPAKYYNLDVIISVGYRVKSKRGILFRKWASRILKEYLVKGYSINEKRMNALNQTIEIQNKMLSASLDIDNNELLNVVNKYTKALSLLDDYDHQVLTKPNGNKVIYELKYDECRSIIDSMKFGDTSNVFGVEKENGKLNGILMQIYQHVFGVELYPTLEEKAAHLLYFLVKDHPFVDGCKRIAATLFLQFLNKNKALVKNCKTIISNDTLVAITLLTAESKPEEMEIIINVIMNLLVD